MVELESVGPAEGAVISQGTEQGTAKDPKQPNSKTADTAAADTAAADTTPTLSIRGGAEWIRVTNPSGSDSKYLWYAVYTIPGTNMKYVFEATKQQMKAIFGRGGEPRNFSTQKGSQFNETMQRGNHYFGGGIGEMEGEESFASAYERAVMAGLGMTSIPESLRNNTKIQALVFLSEQEAWDDEKLLEEVAKTAMFKRRFRHLENFKETGLSLSESITAYLEYEDKIQALAAEFMGGELRQGQIALFMEKKHSLGLVEATMQQFKRIQDNKSAFKAFNDVLRSNGMEPLKGSDFYSFVNGTAAPELYQLYEASSILEAGRETGLGNYLNAATATELARLTRGVTDYGTVYEGLSQAANLILTFRRELDMGQLDHDDLIDIAMGIAPRSGADQTEIGRQMQRLVSQAQGLLADQSTPFYQYSGAGVPGASSLARSRTGV